MKKSQNCEKHYTKSQKLCTATETIIKIKKNKYEKS